jgi:hypothetical protein
VNRQYLPRAVGGRLGAGAKALHKQATLGGPIAFDQDRLVRPNCLTWIGSAAIASTSASSSAVHAPSLRIKLFTATSLSGFKALNLRSEEISETNGGQPRQFQITPKRFRPSATGRRT